jgi:cobalt/nickel transport protein
MNRKDIVMGLIIAVIVAFFLSPLASSWPDGLEKVAHDHGFMVKGEQGSIFKSPIPDYIFPGLKNEKMAIAISGLLGTLVIFGIGYGLASLLKKNKDCR